MKHDFEQHNENRLQRSRELAAKAREKSKDLAEQAGRMLSAIPPGQPILPGHHSEPFHRNYLNKIDNKYRKASEEDKKADYYDSRADAIESNTAISSDDPQAIPKLEEKLKELTEKHEFMKAANALIRNGDREGFLKLPLATPELWEKRSHCGYGTCTLANSNRRIATVKQRLEFLRKLATRKTDEVVIKGVRVVGNVEANRLQLFFPERLPEDKYKLIRKCGFIYCRSEAAFQRKLTNSAIRRAKEFLKEHY